MKTLLFMFGNKNREIDELYLQRNEKFDGTYLEWDTMEGITMIIFVINLLIIVLLLLNFIRQRCCNCR